MNPSPQTDSTVPRKSRPLLLLLAMGTIALGLLSRHFPLAGNYPGDALWATLVFILWVFVFPRQSPKLHFALASLTSFCVEFGQLYHAPWINSIRATLPGRLVLGSGFDPIDLVAYLIGCCIGLLVIRKLAPLKLHP